MGPGPGHGSTPGRSGHSGPGDEPVADRGRRYRGPARSAAALAALAIPAGLGAAPAGLAAPQPPVPSPVVAAVVHAGADGVAIHVRLPLPRLELDGPCARPRLATPDGAGWRSADAEPAYGWLIGVPDAADARLEVAEVDEERWDVDASCAAASGGRGRPSLGPDAVRGAGSGAMPTPSAARPSALPDRAAPAAVLEPAGTLRDQHLARLVVRPVAVAADGRLIVRRAVTLRVRYPHPEAVVRAAPLDGPFAAIAERNLLNAAWLPRRAGLPRAVAEGAPPMPGAVSGQGLDARPSANGDDAAADGRALKVLVDRDGPVVVTGRDAAAAGWDLGAVDPARVGLSTAAGPHALAVEDGGDGRLDPDDRLVFHGQAMSGEFTRQRVFWLRPDGAAPAVPGRRDAAPRAGAAAAQAFTRTMRYEADTTYLYSLHRREGDERWMWGERVDAGRAVTRTLDAPDAVQGAPARLRVRLQGYTDDPAVAPDHHVALRLGGAPLCADRFDGRVPHVLDCAVPSGVLRAGGNELAVALVGDTGAVVDSVYLDWAELAHPAPYAARGDRLDFALPATGAWAVALTGFRDAAIAVADITDPARPVRLDGVAIAPDGAGGFTARLGLGAAEGARFRAWTPAALEAPAGIVRNAPSAWGAPEAGADYVVIGPPELTAPLAPLLERHRAAGLRVAVVDVADVYDERSGGVFDPRAIRAFLQRARDAWPPPAPTYALLVGEANLDYRGGMGAGPPNLVPSVRVEVDTGGSGATTSDVWFGALDGDNDVLPDVLVGRLSATRPDEVTAYVGKLERFAARPDDDASRRRVLLVADDDGAPAFEAFNRMLEERLPASHEATRFDAGSYPRDADLAGDIAGAVERGALALHFTGHGNVDLWSPWPGGGRIFENADIAALRGGPATPLLTTATCMNGMIDHPLRPTSMAELWVRHPQGGGIAAWSPSGFTDAGGQRTLLGAFYDALHDGRPRPVGAAALDAMTAAYAETERARDIVRMFVLLGDPAVGIAGVPAAPTATATVGATPAPPRIHLPALRADG